MTRFLRNEHGVSEAKKRYFSFHRLLIGVQYMFAAARADTNMIRVD